MKHKIIVATGNAGKMKEFRMILADLGLEIISMKEAGVTADIVEDGTTFAENAEIKARAVWQKTGDIVLADDSGLVVDYLGGEPGIYSARYLGEDTSYEVKNRVIIDRLEGAKEEERTARFVCAIAAVLPDGSVLHTESAVEGVIAHHPAGDGGFGSICRSTDRPPRRSRRRRRTRSATGARRSGPWRSCLGRRCDEDTGCQRYSPQGRESETGH